MGEINVSIERNVTYRGENYFLEPWMVVLYYIILQIEGLLSLTTNVCTLVVIVKYIHPVSQSYLLISSLAISDMSSVFMTVLMAILPELEDNGAWYPVCVFFQFWSVVLVYVGLANLVLITIDRYIYITKPLRYDVLFTTTHVKVLIVLMWIVVVLENILIIFFMNE